MADTPSQPQSIHPDEYQADLNPNLMAGQNTGSVGDHPEKDAQTAYDVKDVHRRMRGFSDDELKQIPVVPTGSRLEQGATYLDLLNPGQGEITAQGNMEAGSNTCYVPKSEVDYQLWNRLRGVEDPERVGQGDDR